MRLPKIAAATFLLGLLVLLVFEPTVLRALGVIGIFVGLVAGTFAIATPSFVAGDRDEGPREPPPDA